MARPEPPAPYRLEPEDRAGASAPGPSGAIGRSGS
jgi:hypothetical protein